MNWFQAEEETLPPEAANWQEAADLGKFLESHLRETLLPLEWPAIYQAWDYARRGQLRELLALDQSLATETRWHPLACASRQAGQARLRDLRPLQDQRLLQRYAEAVAAGQAQGWHTLVYGLTLHIFSIPLRQGLLHYAEKTLGGLAEPAGRSLRLPPPALEPLLAPLFSSLPSALEKLLAPEKAALFQAA